MSLFSRLAIDHSARFQVEAADLMPVQSFDTLFAVNAGQSATRDQAMAIPTIARARGIICSTLGSIPLEWINEATGESVPAPRVINQPDPRIPGITFKAWLIEDLIFHPYGYARVLKRYADTGRVAAMERIAPERVATKTNANGTELTGYWVDGTPIAPEDLIVFPSVDEGLLFRAGRTIRAAAQLERSALNFAMNPIPQTVLKNRVGLTKDKLQQLGTAWAKARRESSTAILNGDIDIETIGFDPKALQMNEARQYLALELYIKIKWCSFVSLIFYLSLIGRLLSLSPSATYSRAEYPTPASTGAGYSGIDLFSALLAPIKGFAGYLITFYLCLFRAAIAKVSHLSLSCSLGSKPMLRHRPIISL